MNEKFTFKNYEEISINGLKGYHFNLGKLKKIDIQIDNVILLGLQMLYDTNMMRNKLRICKFLENFDPKNLKIYNPNNESIKDYFLIPLNSKQILNKDLILKSIFESEKDYCNNLFFYK